MVVLLHVNHIIPYIIALNNDYIQEMLLMWNRFFISLCPFTGKKPSLKSFSEIQSLISQGKKREVKLAIRENAWPINSTIRSQLWPALCSQHQLGKGMLDGFYWDMVNQVIL